MRLCRFRIEQQVRWGLYSPGSIFAIDQAVRREFPDLWLTESWESLLPIDAQAWSKFSELVASGQLRSDASTRVFAEQDVQLLPPLAKPPKLLLLAGNYAEHVKEQGDLAAEKRDTFPYVFMKPPSTTLIGSGTPVAIPSISPHKIDHEVELAVVIGKRISKCSAAEAMSAVAGYTIINDISDRGFKPNPGRQTRPRDGFFDWLHGKWHDGFCPCGPCFVTTDEVADPQQLPLTLSIDGEVRQNGSTAQMVFSIAEVIEFVSRFVTLEPGDIISTGTPSGVGNATGRYLKPGQSMRAAIEGIGELNTPVIAEA
ncbi:MAG: fumarylacetoacetate hydrolase family protein [Pirellulales bacterium]